MNIRERAVRRLARYAVGDVPALEKSVSDFPLSSQTWIALIAQTPDSEKLALWDRALRTCPASLELWSAFLASPQAPTAPAARIDVCRRAVAEAGCQFLAGPLWKHLLAASAGAHEAAIEEAEAAAEEGVAMAIPMNKTIDVLRAAIRVPIYAYAEFYQKANDAEAESYDDMAAMAETVSAVVTRMWEYESRLQSADITQVTAREVMPWIEYLDYAESLELVLSGTPFAAVRVEVCRQLYERCMAATPLIPAMWRRYTDWARRHLDAGACARVLGIALTYHPRNRSLQARAARFLAVEVHSAADPRVDTVVGGMANADFSQLTAMADVLRADGYLSAFFAVDGRCDPLWRPPPVTRRMV